MPPARRPSLTDMAVPKLAPVPAAQAPAETAPRPEEDGEGGTKRYPPADRAEPAPRRVPTDMRTVQVRINKEGWRALRDLASDNDTSLEALMVEALNEVLLKHQRPPIVARRVGERGTELGEKDLPMG